MSALTARPVLRASACAVFIALLVGQSPAVQAAGPPVWPVDGAPVCNAPGDQHRLFGSFSSCNAMSLGWASSVPGADTLVLGGVTPQPPVGSCPSDPRALVDATGVTEASATEVNSGIVALPTLPPPTRGDVFPGCIGPSFAFVWLQGSGPAQQLVAYTPIWYAHERQVVDDGDAVRQHPRMAAGSGAFFMDTALVVVWSDERTGVPQIRAQRITMSGIRDWGPTGLLIAPTSAAQTDPEISRLQDGSTLVVWLDARSGGSDVYALRLLPNGSPAPGWPAGGLALESREEESSAPRIVDRGLYEGPSFVVWEESGPRFGGGRSIVALRLLDDFTPDPSMPLGVPVTTSPTVERLQDVTPSAVGFVAVWTDTRSATAGNPTDLYAQWTDGYAGPAPGWPASGLALCTAPGRQDAAVVSAARTGTYAAFAWEDHRGADADIYAELRLANGSLPTGLWQTDGLPATSAPGDQTAPVVGDGNGGGCFVAWQDARDQATLGLDIYAQAFTSEGEKLDVPPFGVPPRALLGAPQPNPTRSSSAFVVDVPFPPQTVRVDVVDLAGRRVRTIAHGTYPVGRQSFTFDGLDDNGRPVPPGVYRVHARVGDATMSQTLVRVN